MGQPDFSIFRGSEGQAASGSPVLGDYATNGLRAGRGGANLSIDPPNWLDEEGEGAGGKCIRMATGPALNHLNHLNQPVAPSASIPPRAPSPPSPPQPLTSCSSLSCFLLSHSPSYILNNSCPIHSLPVLVFLVLHLSLFTFFERHSLTLQVLICIP